MRFFFAVLTEAIQIFFSSVHLPSVCVSLQYPLSMRIHDYRFPESASFERKEQGVREEGKSKIDKSLSKLVDFGAKKNTNHPKRVIGIFGGGRWISPDGDKLRLHLPRKEKYQSPQKGNWYFWWGKMDSNHRRHCQQIYSLSPLATREFPHMQFCQKVELVDGLEPPTC